jgi:hypothetical protein
MRFFTVNAMNGTGKRVTGVSSIIWNSWGFRIEAGDATWKFAGQVLSLEIKKAGTLCERTGFFFIFNYPGLESCAKA